MTKIEYHIPVLLHECIEGLNLRSDGNYVDVTFGGGGHSRQILNGLTPGKLIVFDQDARALENVTQDARVIGVNQNFRFMRNFLSYHNVLPVDGILADLGVSSHQFDTADRGFSTRFDGPLDMRMNPKSDTSASTIVASFDEFSLMKMFRDYGELEHSNRIAKAIVQARFNAPIQTTNDLKQVLVHVAPKGKENQFYAQVFQALRIEVNNELEVLKEFLKQSLKSLKAGGRLVVISYHSLEDRLVKNIMKSGNFEGEVNTDVFGNRSIPFKLITKKPVLPSADEMISNPRSRSARLRIAEKVE